MLTRTLLLQLASNWKMESFFRTNSRAAAIARRFIAGEKMEDVVQPVRELNRRGISVSLDFLGESVRTQEETAIFVDTYLRLLQLIGAEALRANVSLKLTSLGLDIGFGVARRNLERILTAAGPDQFIRIDMEGSEYTQRTLDLFFEVWDAPHSIKNAGVVIQAYLHRSDQDVERLIAAGARVRLCKGAYREPHSIAYTRREDIDRSYVALMKRLLTSGVYPAIATHDGAIVDEAKRFASENAISPDRFEFQMLYGVRRDLQVQLAREGYNMRVYTPFGDHWYPYMMRRLAERPANLLFALRSMVGG